MIYFTSDLHLNHNKDFIYEPRGFNSIVEMNKGIVTKFNEVLTEKDTLYILGDLVMGKPDEKTQKMINSIKGNKKIILGNHDGTTKEAAYKLLKDTEVLGYCDKIKYKKYEFYLSHFPMLISDTDYNKNNKTICLCGHTHTIDKFRDMRINAYHIEVDAHNCYPVSIEQIVEDIKEYYKNEN